MGFFQFLFFIYISLCCCDTSMGQTCFIEVIKNNINSPIFETTFGSKTLKVSISDTNQIALNDDEFLDGYCATKFSSFMYYLPISNENNDYYNTKKTQLTRIMVDNAHNVSLQCDDGIIYVLVLENSEYFQLVEGSIFSCQDYKNSIYEATFPYEWCSPKATSYVLGMEIMKDKVQLASVCFNFDNLSLESIRYTINRDDLVLSQERLRTLHLSTLNTKMENSEINQYALSVINDNLRRASNLGYAHNHLFKVAVYKRGLIIQDGPLVEFFLKYGKFLEVTLWHNLAHGNWKRFTNALSQRANNVTYEIFTGVAGTIKVPYFNDCKKFKMEWYNIEGIPSYIWAFLRASNGSEEFVIIGFNSPFFDFFDIKEIIFCRDICNEISWISGISSTFRYSALGVVFCCTPEDVHNAGVLKGFPKINKTVEVKTEIPTLNYSENSIVSIEDD